MNKPIFLVKNAGGTFQCSCYVLGEDNSNALFIFYDFETFFFFEKVLNITQMQQVMMVINVINVNITICMSY